MRNTSDKENEILTAIVQRVEPKGVYVELGRTEGIHGAQRHDMPGEEYCTIDDHIKVYVLEVQRATGREMLHGPQVRVSRIHPGSGEAPVRDGSAGDRCAAW